MATEGTNTGSFSLTNLIGKESNFIPSQCFYAVTIDSEDYDNLYCAGGTIIMILSGINTLLFGYLIFVHLKG